jgi:PTH1 family peptidyl-tRNA hydrolase
MERLLANRSYARLRVGIGRHEGDREIANYVLGRFTSTETVLLDKVLAAATDQALCWLEAGSEIAMNRFNGAVEDSAKEGKEK